MPNLEVMVKPTFVSAPLGALLTALCLSLPVRASDDHDHGHDHGHDHPPATEAKAVKSAKTTPAKPKGSAKASSGTPAKAPAPAAYDEHDLEAPENAYEPAPSAGAAGHVAPAHPATAQKITVVVQGAMNRLKEGNQRYASGKPGAPRRSRDQRTLVSQAQLPFAIIVGCADSRVPPEIVFDQGLGDLFVIRVAGNVLDDPSLGSIEYAVEHLGSRLIVILGHERCGAVDAACKGGHPGGHVGSLVQAIRPAVEAARRHKGDNLLADAVKANVQRVVDQVKGSWPVLGPEVREGKLSVVGGIYDLETGLVDFLP
jgi:carbonic anhydrase